MSDPMWTPPFRVDKISAHLWDAKGRMVAQGRGWGGLTGGGHGAYAERDGRGPLTTAEAAKTIHARVAAIAHALNRLPDAEAEIAALTAERDRLRADLAAAEAEAERFRVILEARDAYDRGEPSNPPHSGREKVDVAVILAAGGQHG